MRSGPLYWRPWNVPCTRLSIKSYNTLIPRIHPRSVSRSASVVAGKTTSLQKGMADCSWAGTKSAVARIRAGCGVRGSWGRVSWSSGSTVELRVCGSLKLLPFTYCVRTPSVRRARSSKKRSASRPTCIECKSQVFIGRIGESLSSGINGRRVHDV